MNQITIIGRITTDIDVQTSASGTSFTKFTIAQNDAFKKEHTNFFNCTAFGKTAESLGRFMKKGNRICVIGKVEIKIHNEKYYTQVNVSQVEFLESNKGQVGNTNEKSKMGQPLNINELPPKVETKSFDPDPKPKKKESGVDYDDIPWEI